MTAITRAAAKAEAVAIKAETTDGANTALRVGGTIEDIVDSVLFTGDAGIAAGDGLQGTTTFSVKPLGTTLTVGPTGVKLRDAASGGQELFYDGSAWQLIGRLTAAVLTDASATLQFTTANQYIWPAAVDSASARALTFGTTGLAAGPMAGSGAIASILFLRTSYTSPITALNGGAGGGTMFTLPAALGKAVMVSFYYDATNWSLAGWEYITVTAA